LREKLLGRLAKATHLPTWKILLTT